MVTLLLVLTTMRPSPDFDELATRLERCELELAKTRKELEKTRVEASRLRGVLARRAQRSTEGGETASYLHKLGTPLNLIGGYVQLLLRRVRDEEAVSKLRLIQEQVGRMTSIVRSLLDETWRPAGDWRPVHVGALIERVLVAMEPALAARGVRTDKRIPPELPPILGDEAGLEQVIVNLVENALQAMPEGGSLSVRAESAGDKVELRISDTGVGISPSDLDRVFQPLYTTKAAGEGSGLGLSIVSDILDDHGGDIWVESVLGEGTTFTLELPCTRREPRRLPKDRRPRIVSFHRRPA